MKLTEEEKTEIHDCARKITDIGIRKCPETTCDDCIFLCNKVCVQGTLLSIQLKLR